MAKMLDFNAFVQPTLPLTFADAARTVVNVTVPSEKLVEKLAANLGELQELAKHANKETVAACYGLAADLISCNLEDVAVTADDLRNKYGVGLLMLVAFFNAYIDFIGEIKSAKN